MIKVLSACAPLLFLGLFPSDNGFAQVQDPRLVRHGEAAIAFASGAIQKATPRDGIVNLVTGDNQSSGNRMLLGIRDTLYLKLDKPTAATVGDLFTVYRRVRKVFHPLTREYLGSITIRVAVVQVIDVGHALTTAETVVGYGPILPGDLVMRFSVPSMSESGQGNRSATLEGMIVEIQADKPMTMVSQSNIVYVDRGRADGLQVGDIVDLYRHSVGLPVRKIGQLKILSTEDRTATARVIKASTRVFKGDRFKRTGTTESTVSSLDTALSSEATAETTEASSNENTASTESLLAPKLAMQQGSGESRLNLGDFSNVLYYDSGQAMIKPEGHHVLDQLIAYLRGSGDSRLIRVEGHTDNVEIGPSLRSQYPTNLDLSNARADAVVRYLVEKGGFDPARVTAVGYGESKPAATNAHEQGRRKNRRVEIVLYEPHVSTTANEARRRAQHEPVSVSSERRTGDALSDPMHGQRYGRESGTFSITDQTSQATFPDHSAALDPAGAPATLSDNDSQSPLGDDTDPSSAPSGDSSPRRSTPDQANNPDSSGS